MTDDPIVAEVRKARREILESHNWDYRKMLADAMKRQGESGRTVVSAESTKPQSDVSRDVYGADTRQFRQKPGGDAAGHTEAE